MKKTLVLGASPNSSRFANQAVKSLKRYGEEVVPIGIREGIISGEEIRIGEVPLKDVHTVTIYLRAELQKQYYNYILDLDPSRIIFNPGAENEEFAAMAEREGIETLNACTLVLLSSGNY
jgi:hypothetical protein